jgi:hypothetical protein
MTLQEIRDEWERGLKPLVVLNQSNVFGRVLVILEKKDKYHCHRYFNIGLDWTCSVDKQSVPLEQVWQWLNTSH